MTITQKDNAVHLAKQIDGVGHDITGLNIDNRRERIHRLRTKHENVGGHAIKVV